MPTVSHNKINVNVTNFFDEIQRLLFRWRFGLRPNAVSLHRVARAAAAFPTFSAGVYWPRNCNSQGTKRGGVPSGMHKPKGNHEVGLRPATATEVRRTRPCNKTATLGLIPAQVGCRMGSEPRATRREFVLLGGFRGEP